VPIFEAMIDPHVIDSILPGGSYADLLDLLDIDCAVTPTPSRMYNLELVREDDGTRVYRSEWGELRASTGEMVTIPIEYPIKTRADWESYQVPDFARPGRLDNLDGLVARFKGRRAIGCHLHDSFTYPSYLFGMSELFMNLFAEPEWTKEVIAACTEHCVGLTELAVKAGADFIMFGDDVGGSTGPMMSPKHYEEFFLPGLAVVAKAHELGAKVLKHTDGTSRSSSPCLSRSASTLPPSDPSSGMDIVEVKRMFGDRFTVCGGVDTGAPLSDWSVPELVAEVRRRIRELAPGGGWMIASSNSIHSGVRPENFQAQELAARVYGTYGRLDEVADPALEMLIGRIPMDAPVGPQAVGPERTAPVPGPPDAWPVTSGVCARPTLA
jgi:uroporphyrinogen decarboxylase